MKTNCTPPSPRRRSRTDQILLPLLVLASVAVLIVACTRVRPPAAEPVTSRSFAEPSHRVHSHSASAGAASHLPSYAIDRSWPAVPEEMAGGIDAALNWENGAYSWFRGHHLSTLHLQAGPQATAELQRIGSQGQRQNEFWPGLDAPEITQIDAALFWDAHTAYVFHGTTYSELDLQRKQFRAPVPIDQPTDSNPWRNLPEAFSRDLDAVVNDGLGNILLFKGSAFIRYDQYLQRVVEGPVRIAEQWDGLPQVFHAGVDAAMRRGRGKVTLFRDGLNVEVTTSEAL
ncbi:MAG: hemopexin repeat-containing protein [Bacteroidota bacterium]